MNISLFEKLYREGAIGEDTLNSIKDHDRNGLVSVHYDLLTLLYFGIFLLTTALGVIIYKNIDSIGHIAIVTAIAVSTVACFGYCLHHSKGFSFFKVESPGILFDYVLLLGCLLLLVLVSYLQLQFNIFGQRWGMATFVPMVLLFAAAYYFDHLGVLSLAIVNLAAWVGISITPLHLLRDNNFNDQSIIYSGIVLGLVLEAANKASRYFNIKEHFSFTYKNFGCHLLFVALLAAVMVFTLHYFLWFLLLVLVSAYHFLEAYKQRSFYFLVLSAIYFFIGISYVIIHSLLQFAGYGNAITYLVLFYLVGASLALVFILMHFNKKFKEDARLS